MFRLQLKSRLIRRFAEDRSGIAAVEFALILPLLIMLYFGTVEAATLYAVDRKVATVASTMADLVSRHRDKISQSDTLAKYFTAAQAIMNPYPTTGLTQVVSLLFIDSNGVANVEWSVGYNGGAPRTVDTQYPLAATTEINQLARGASGYLIVSEIAYPYKPVIGLIFSEPVNLAHTEYFLPRYASEIDLT